MVYQGVRLRYTAVQMMLTDYSDDQNSVRLACTHENRNISIVRLGLHMTQRQSYTAVQMILKDDPDVQSPASMACIQYRTSRKYTRKEIIIAHGVDTTLRAAEMDGLLMYWISQAERLDHKFWECTNPIALHNPISSQPHWHDLSRVR